VKTSDFDYELPSEFIAQTPLEPRDSARLLVFHLESGKVEHRIFKDLRDYLDPGDLLVINETRVMPARLYARKIHSGGRAELLLLKQRNETTWEVLVGGSRLVKGVRLQVEAGPIAEILAELDGAQRLVKFSEPIGSFLKDAGHVPLPPYINTRLQDPERYQTVFSRQIGSAAAPTAGLHFTQELLDSLQSDGIGILKVNLHIGLDTFAPVTENDPHDHRIHSEWCQVTPDAAQKINKVHAAGGRIIAVGTTSVRALESAAKVAGKGEVLRAYDAPTDLYILPGYDFRVVQGMITNFHLPKSTLIMMISAFIGRERLLSVYEIAKKESYRFYSFGDAMLII